MEDKKLFFNVICEEMGITGGKVIHMDTKKGDIEEVHKLVTDNLERYPNAKWELYPVLLTL